MDDVCDLLTLAVGGGGFLDMDIVVVVFAVDIGGDYAKNGLGLVFWQFHDEKKWKKAS